MKPIYLLDSAILIDHLRGISQATTWLQRLHEGEAVISVITRAEVLSGGTVNERAVALDLCEQFECLPVSKGIADHAADLHRANRWKLPDAFQAALAKDKNLRLVTRNTRDFDEKAHAFALIPYRL